MGVSMSAWMLRAVGLGAVVVALRLLLGFAMVYWPTWGTAMRVLCLVIIVAATVWWAVRDARADPGADLLVRWLQVAVAAGLGSGLVCWLLDFVPGIDLGDSGALFELTAGASFIVLLIFLPALAGAAFGRRRPGRDKPSAPTAEPSSELSPAL
ncbi:B-4DMT family transporter [Nocardia thailandica]|uniref:B-4DMT family transporter n=1 Tax=Nocardia thailandica TaxID=257275 RepID=A0ABW6PPG4_9NOCA|nr:B-4DMT family transporter [Nocardia thailandica]